VRLRRFIACGLCAASLASQGLGAADSPSLPDYRPEREVAGVLRSRGSDQVTRLMALWGEGFRRYHPRVVFENTLRGDASAMIGLEESIADFVVMTRQIVPYDTYGVWRRSHRMPIEIVVATGSQDASGKAEALAIFVNKDNPIAKLTVTQLDGIFGAQRTGGWKGMEWEPAVARDSSGDIRTWGQLGLTGEWADKPIHPYGPPATFPGGMSYFQIRVMGGADTRAEGLREYPDPVKMIAALGGDRSGIAYGGISARSARVKAIAIADQAGGEYVECTRENVRDGRYPLARSVYVYLPPDAPTGDSRDPPIDTKVREFLRYVLSRQGQEDVAREGDYLPLPAEKARAQREQLR
jgi:phosphate transport system substrate-binding protein